MPGSASNSMSTGIRFALHVDWRQNGEAGAFARQEPHHGHAVYAGDVKAKRIETLRIELGVVGLQLGAGAETFSMLSSSIRRDSRLMVAAPQGMPAEAGSCSVA
jgi:hypothetical protein